MKLKSAILPALIVINALFTIMLYGFIGRQALAILDLESLIIFGIGLTIFNVNISLTILLICLLEGWLLLFLYKKLSKQQFAFGPVVIIMFVLQFVAIGGPQWYEQITAAVENPIQDGSSELIFIDDEAILNDRIAMKTNLMIIGNNVIWNEHIKEEPSNVWGVFVAELDDELTKVNVKKVSIPQGYFKVDDQLCYETKCYNFETKKLEDKPNLQTEEITEQQLGFYPFFAASHEVDNICLLEMDFSLDSQREDNIFHRFNFDSKELEELYKIEGTNEHVDSGGWIGRGTCSIYVCNKEDIVYSCQNDKDDSLKFYEYDIDNEQEELVKDIEVERMRRPNDVKLVDGYLYFASAENVISRMKVGKYLVEEVVTAQRKITDWDVEGNLFVYLEAVDPSIDSYASVLRIKKLKNTTPILR